MQLQHPSAADPIIPHRNWIAARENALHALQQGSKITAVLGPAGVGKSRLLEDLAHTLDASGVDVWLLPPGEPVISPYTEGVVLLDEDCHTNADIWARMFQGLGQYVIAGQPMLAQYLRTLPHSVQIVFINPLDADEVGPFLAAQLMQAGEPADLFTQGAVDGLTAHTGGIPQTLNSLAQSALLLADTEHDSCVRRRHVDEAASHEIDVAAISRLHNDPPPGKPHFSKPEFFNGRWTKRTIGFACGGAAAAVVVLALSFSGSGSRAPAATNPAVAAPVVQSQAAGPVAPEMVNRIAAPATPLPGDTMRAEAPPPPHGGNAAPPNGGATPVAANAQPPVPPAAAPRPTHRAHARKHPPAPPPAPSPSQRASR